MTQEIRTRLDKFRNLREIQRIKDNHKKAWIPRIQNTFKEVVASRQEVADTFAEFYENLYCTQDVLHRNGGVENLQCHEQTSKMMPIPSFTTSELDLAISRLKNEKSGDSRGIAAEMLKHSGTNFREVLLKLFQ